MKVQSIDGMFNFTYEKPASEIIAKAALKAAAIRDKINEREARIAKVRSEYQITDGMLIDILSQARDQMQRGGVALVYNSTVRSDDGMDEQDVSIGAGVVNMLLTERDHIEGEKAQVERLDLITRNLCDLRKFTPDGKEYMQGHNLSASELKFLGF